MWSTGYLSTADWNDTNFNNPEFDELLLRARAETDQAAREDMYGRMAEIVWSEGGLINPMFNQSLDGYSDLIKGVETYDRALMGGAVIKLTWMT
jgi:peptide/nickel transport system substrate-binding protein